jgi:hypothetical protein
VICVIWVIYSVKMHLVRILSILHFNKVSPCIILILLYDMRSLVTSNNDLVMNTVNISNSSSSFSEPFW